MVLSAFVLGVCTGVALFMSVLVANDLIIKFQARRKTNKARREAEYINKRFASIYADMMATKDELHHAMSR